jgi:hypothetical protein
LTIFVQVQGRQNHASRNQLHVAGTACWGDFACEMLRMRSCSNLELFFCARYATKSQNDRGCRTVGVRFMSTDWFGSMNQGTHSTWIWRSTTVLDKMPTPRQLFCLKACTPAIDIGAGAKKKNTGIMMPLRGNIATYEISKQVEVGYLHCRHGTMDIRSWCDCPGTP